MKLCRQSNYYNVRQTYFCTFHICFTRTIANNRALVYQHSARCPYAMQRFLDANPTYACLVPMPWHEAKIADASASSISISVAANIRELQQSPAFVAKTMFFAPVLGDMTRSRQEAGWLSKSVPKPPSGFRFSARQIRQQIEFFEQKKDSRTHPLNLVDFYSYAIVAVCMYSSATFLFNITMIFFLFMDSAR